MAESKSYLNCKKMKTAISRAKVLLIKKAEKNGLYENFGEDEYRDIKDKFINLSDPYIERNANLNELQHFADWSGNYSLKDMR